MQNDIRISSNGIYRQENLPNIQTVEQNKNSFNELINMVSVNKETSLETKINFSSLGAPPGFVADISMISEEDANIIGIVQI